MKLLATACGLLSFLCVAGSTTAWAAPSLSIGTRHYTITMAGQALGACTCTCAHPGTTWTLSAKAEVFGARSEATVSVGTTLSPQSCTLLSEQHVAAGVNFPMAVHVTCQGPNVSQRWQVTETGWRQKDGFSGPGAILPQDLSPVFYEWIVRRLDSLPEGAILDVDIPAKHLHRHVRRASRDGATTILLFETLHVQVTLDARGVQRLAIPEQNVVVQAVPSVPAWAPLPALPAVTREIVPPNLPTSHRDEEVTATAADGIQLSGTLTLPSEHGLWPAVLIVPGSGPVDRDGHVGGCHPYLDLADWLAQAGIATLRYDKRGVGQSQPGARPATAAAYESDVRTMLHALEDHAEIDGTHLFLLGHSEGGPLVVHAAQSENVAGVITLAGEALPVDRTVEEQMAFQQGLLKKPLQTISATRAQIRAAFAAIRSHTLDGDTLMGMSGDYWRSFMDLQPQAELAALHKPILVLQGSNDIQVLADETRQLVESLGDSHPGLKLVELEGDNHLFAHPGYQGIGDDYELPLGMDPRAIVTIAQWVKVH